MAGRILKILAIDDNQDNLTIIKALISEAFPDIITITALNGKTGIELAAAEDPDVILLDIVMPDMDGFEVCERLKVDPKSGDIPVVFLTSLKGEKEIRIRALEAGAEAFLAKPIDQSELTAQIRAMVKIKTANIEKRYEKERLAELVEVQTLELIETHKSTLNLLEDLKRENAARKQSEAIMRQSEEKYRAIFENVQDVFYQTDLKGIVLEISPSIKHFSEFNRDDIIGKPVYDLYYNPDDRMILLENIKEKGELRDFELKLKTKTGNLKYVSINARLILNQSGQPDHIDGAIRDITQRILAEKELQENEEKYRKLVELSPDAVLIHTDGIIQFANAASVKIFDATSKNDLIGKKVTDLVHTDYQKTVKQRIRKVVEEDEKAPLIEEKLVSLKGRIFDADVSATPIVLKGEKGVQVVARDISDRKKAEQAIAVSEARYRTISRLSSDFSYSCLHGKNGYEVEWITEAFFTITGYDNNDLKKNKCWLFSAYPDDKKHALKLLNDLKPGESSESELRIVAKNGDIHYIINKMECFNDADCDNGKRVYGAVQDITDRKKIEKALKNSEEKYRLLFESASQTILVAQDNMIRFANPKAAELLGVSLEEIVSIPFIDFIHPDDREMVFNNYSKRLKGEPTINNYHFRVVRKDSTFRWVEISAVLFEWDGRVASLNFLSDITEHMLAEDELRLSEEKFRTLYENAPVGLYRTTPDGQILLANRALVQILGYSSFGELSVRKLDESGFEPSYERNQFIEQIEKYGEVRDLEAKWICNNGNVIIVKESAKVIYDSDGKILYYDGTVEDITGLKQAENRINLTSNILKLLNKSIPLAETIQLTLDLIQQETGIKALGIRLKNGDDYPYFVQNGFNDDFLRTENSLLSCSKEGGICLDENGNPSLECTCGLVISGKADLTNPLFTKGGSFWTNNSPVLLGLTAAEEPRHNPRNRCIHEGFNSVALIPIRSKSEIVGLLQLNDKKNDCFTADQIQFFESIGEIIGVALMRKQAEEALEQSHKLLFKLSEQVPGVIYQYRLYPDGRSCFPYSSSRMNDIYEYSPDDVREDAAPVFGRIHPDDHDHVSNLIFESARTLNHFYCEFRVVLPKQGLRWRYSTAVPERMDDGSTLWHGIIYDLTDRKNVEQALQSKYDELENFNSLMIGREIKMLELKKEINELLKKAGKEAKYVIFE